MNARADFSALREALPAVSEFGNPQRRHRTLALAVVAAVAQSALAIRCARGAAPTDAWTPVAVSKGLRRGDRLTQEAVTFPLQASGASLATLLTREQVGAMVDHYVTKDIPEGTPLSVELLSEDPVLPVDVAAIPPGRVLFPLSVRLGALAAHLKAGQKVDVLAHMSLPEVGVVTETLLEAVAVVGVGEGQGADGRSPGDVVSFHLKPEEMKLLVHAQKFSEFHLALRNPNETGREDGGVAMTLNRFMANPRIQQALASDVFRIRTANKELPDEH